MTALLGPARVLGGILPPEAPSGSNGKAKAKSL